MAAEVSGAMKMVRRGKGVGISENYFLRGRLGLACCIFAPGLQKREKNILGIICPHPIFIQTISLLTSDLLSGPRHFRQFFSRNFC